MRRRFFVLLTVLLLALSLGAVLPVSAAEAPIGTQVNVLFGFPTTISAGESFHVVHGWANQPSESHAIGAWGFRLEIDGEDQGAGSLINTADPEFNSLTRQWLYNYEDGLTAGEYRFTGHWFWPCRDAVDAGFYTGECKTPNAPVEANTAILNLTVTG